MAEPGKAPFEPFVPEIAAVLAHRLAADFKAYPRDIDGRSPRCTICRHKNREIIDRYLLMDAALRLIHDAMEIDYPDRKYWKRPRIEVHRDKHLLPALDRARERNNLAMIVPFPRDGSPEDKDWWHFMRLYAIQEEAMKNRATLVVAVTCQVKMREIDLGIRGLMRMKPVNPQIGHDEIQETDETSERIERAFAASARKVEEDDAPTPTS